MNDGNADGEDDKERVGNAYQFSAKKSGINIQGDRFENPKSKCEKEENHINELLFFYRVYYDEHAEEYR